jgi:hypothetical protein
MTHASQRSILQRLRAEPRVEQVLRAARSALLLLPLLYVHFAPMKNALVEGLLWSTLFLVACWGYGSALARALSLRLDHGLRTVTGASLVLCVGGWALAIGCFTRSFSLCSTWLGCLLALGTLWLPSTRARNVPMRTLALRNAAMLFWAVVGLLCIAVALADWRLHPADDAIAYTAFPEKILATGRFLEPYSFRRLSALGGQSVLLAYLWPHIDPEQSFVADRGVGLCLVFLQIAFLPRRTLAASAWGVSLRMGAGLFACSLAALGINTASMLTGVAWMLCALRLTDLTRRAQHKRYWLLAALVAAALASLRQFYLLPAAVCLLASMRNASPRGALAPLAALAAIAGYCISALQSNGTFLYPLFAGSTNPGIALTAPFNPFVAIRILRLAERPSMLVCLGIAFAVAETAPRARRLELVAGGVFACLLVVALGISDTKDIERYAIAIVAAIAITAALSIKLDKAPTRAAISAAIFSIGALCIAKQARDTPETWFRALSTAWSASPRAGRTPTWEAIEMRKAQATIPRGARVFAAVDDPYLLDFSRNDVVLADMPGYTGGLPTLSGAGPVLEHLRAHGFEYVLYVRPSHSKDYFRTEFRQHMLTLDNVLWRTIATLTLDFSESLNTLSALQPLLYDQNGLIVMKLGALP